MSIESQHCQFANFSNTLFKSYIKLQNSLQTSWMISFLLVFGVQRNHGVRALQTKDYAQLSLTYFNWSKLIFIWILYQPKAAGHNYVQFPIILVLSLFIALLSKSILNPNSLCWNDTILFRPFNSRRKFVRLIFLFSADENVHKNITVSPRKEKTLEFWLDCKHIIYIS